eukprot:6181167-Pleurochrysis_carterae.AAC.9
MPEPPERAVDEQLLGVRRGTHVVGLDTAARFGTHPRRDQHEERKSHCHKHHTRSRQESLLTAKGCSRQREKKGNTRGRKEERSPEEAKLGLRRGESKQESTNNRRQTLIHTNGQDQIESEPPERAADKQLFSERRETHVVRLSISSTLGMHSRRNQHERRKPHRHKHQTCLQQGSLSKAMVYSRREGDRWNTQGKKAERSLEQVAGSGPRRGESKLDNTNSRRQISAQSNGPAQNAPELPGRAAGEQPVKDEDGMQNITQPESPKQAVPEWLRRAEGK